MKIADIIFRDDLYPRFRKDQDLVELYSNSIEYLPPIKVSQQNILIDGWHRLKAHQLAKCSEIKVDTITVESEKELKKLAYQFNSNHGLQLKAEEKKTFANEMIGEMTVDELTKILSVSRQIVELWTKAKRGQQEEERNRKILELYLRAWNTQETIAGVFGVEQKTISNIINASKNAKISEITKDFKPILYNIWNLQKQDNVAKSHFGSFPQVFMENLLYYHTQPLDIIYDPFAGGGTTVDTCQKMLRRYYCSDKEVRAGREADILQYDIANGLPDNLPKADLVFLDPPYNLLAKGEYSDDNTDLGNMDIPSFYNVLHSFVKLLMQKNIKRIAYVIRPFWVTCEKWEWVDPIFRLYDVIKDKYHIEARYVLPYSTEQYTGLWVDRAKVKQKCLILNRDLMVFERN